MKPLAIDLREPEFGRRAYLPIKQLVARRAKHPKHVSLGVAHKRPGTVASVLRSVGNLEDAILPAAFASRGNVRVPPAHPIEFGVLVRTAGVVLALARRIATSPKPPQFARCLASTICGAVALVRAWRRDVEVLSAPRTIAACLRDICLLSTAAAAGASYAWLRAIELIRPYGHECCGALSTGQVIHSGPIA